MLVLALIAAVVAPATSKTMALDDWHAMKILSVGRDASALPPYYVRVQAGDLDGDGIADQADLKLVCADGVLTQSLYTVISSRDPATGQSSGRRMHQPMTFATEGTAASPQLSDIRPTYDVKQMDRARVGKAKWANIQLHNADRLCPAASAAARQDFGPVQPNKH